LKQTIVPIWKIWDQDRIDEPEKKGDKRRITKSKQKKYKATKITTTSKVTSQLKSTKKAPDYTKGKTYIQATFDDLETVVLEKNATLYGNAFND